MFGILLIALSLHGLFEGTALGVQSKAKDAILIAVAILAHKWAEGFALGISFVNSKTEEECDRNNSMVIIYPKDPYGKRDYTTRP